VARALCADPPLLLMDEPFGALDPITRADVQREFAALRRRLNKTVVLVTHDVREALALADRIAVLRQGSLAFVGTPAELWAWSDPEAAAVRASLENPWTRS
jgi:osmoprotectant transport system ATP-binding protein